MTHMARCILIVLLLTLGLLTTAGSAAVQDQHHQFQNIDLDWSAGSINAVNSNYAENDIVPYRYEITGLPGDACVNMTIHYDFTKGGKYACDFLATYNATESGPLFIAGGLLGNGPPGPLTTLTNDDVDYQALAIPDDMNIHTDNLWNASYGTQYFAIGGNYTTVEVVGNITHPTPAQIAGDSEKTITLKIHTSGLSNETDKQLIIGWGGHLALGNAANWGEGNGSASISGAPFHQHTSGFVDENCNDIEDQGEASLGGGDRSIQGGAIHFVAFCISGYKLDEINGPHAGWNITVTNMTLGVDETVMTDVNGYWEVCNLTQGIYDVSEELKPNWVAVDPADGDQDVTLVDQSMPNVNFTNRMIPQFGKITGMKGDKKCPECGLEGWVISLKYASNGTVFATTTTGPDGRYKFMNVPYGTYWLNETLILGWKQITPNMKVTLNATNPDFKYNFINAEDKTCCVCPPTASFSYLKKGQKVQFTDTSTGPHAVRWIWFFGDGTISMQQNPQKIYSKPGSYTVRLYITWADCDGITYQWKDASQRIRVP